MMLVYTLKRAVAASVRVWPVFAVLISGFSVPADAEPGSGKTSLNRPDLGILAPKLQVSDHWEFGVGAAVRPEYQGSDDYEIQPVPIFDIRYGRFFAITGEGIGFNVIETPTFTAGASVDWMQGYDGGDVARGVHDVDDEMGGRLFMAAQLNGAAVSIAATQAVTDTDRGLLLNADIAYPIEATDRLTIAPSLGITWANEKYMDGYFGINASESAASGLSQYEPADGFKDVSFRISVGYRLTDSISANGSVGVTHLLGEAADSPIVEEETQPTALFGLTYTF